jgi:alpha-beta hydrolase superfamily lysophospholipase
MVGDWAAEIGGGMMYDLQLHYIQGLPWVDREEWDSRSALTFVTNVVTPTLLLHGERDGISTVNQSQMFYTALHCTARPRRARALHQVSAPGARYPRAAPGAHRTC